jgi:hypothetical protein
MRRSHKQSCTLPDDIKSIAAFPVKQLSVQLGKTAAKRLWEKNVSMEARCPNR